MIANLLSVGVGRWRIWFLSMLLLFGMSLAGCGGGGGSDDGVAGGAGEVFVGLTDADGDFATYTVDVLSLTLTRADGAVIDALPISTRVDFAQYTDLTEFITVATVPLGVYTHVDMTLDYTNADIRAASGNDVVSLTPLDEHGNPITALTMNVKFDGRYPLVVRPGIPAILSLDFDLEATNTVDLVVNTVMVEPLLLAEVDIDPPKVHRVRGPLVSVNLDASHYVVALRPFYLRHGHFGRLRVKTNDDSLFEIDQISYQGADGLAQLATMPVGTATVALGRLNLHNRTFLAHEVYAGSSVPFGAHDVVRGSVVARVGDTLTVRGATLVRMDGTVIFNDDVSVLLDASTKVTKQLGGDVDIGDISVGQRITAFGTLTGDIHTKPTLDATNGLVRMRLSSIAGSTVLIDPSLLTVNLQTINGRPASIYDFTGTGVGGHDSDPTNYRIATGNLSLGTLAIDDPVRVRGFVVSFGQADTHDFDAHTVIDLSEVPAWLSVAWSPPTSNAFSDLTEQAMVIVLTDSVVHYLVQRGVITDLTLFGSDPTVQPHSDGAGLFAIVRGRTVELYTTFANFVEGLSAQIDTHPVHYVGARGGWDGNTITLTSRLAVVRLVP
ncbi:MAG: metallophosphoesterase [Gammaproteobacteria bacterium]|jgi:hypothetical protein|nr:metallophosphoesterase [Gammaproteobacteria bacterium]